MPRPKKTDAQRMAERFGELYRIGKARSMLTDAQCATIAGVCRATLSEKKKNPSEKITIGELSRLGKAFGWSDEDFLAIVRPGK